MIINPQDNLPYTDILNLYKQQYAQTGNPLHNHKETEANKYEWVKIPIRLNFIYPELLPFVIAINEICRFEVGNTQPEQRLTENFIVSKKISQEGLPDIFTIRTLFSYWDKMVNSHLFWEGMGRVVLAKYLFQDNDFNIYNALIDSNNYFIGLDADKCFWEVTEKYHKQTDVKVMAVNYTPFYATTGKAVTGKPIYVIKDKKRGFIGEMHAEDYENLPLLKHQYPSDWFFVRDELRNYSRALSKDQRFLNEKYFATIKALVTTTVKHLIIDLNITVKKDNTDALHLLSTQIQKLTEVCKRSEGFIEYLRKNRSTAIKAILYEVMSYFAHNPQYRLEDESSHRRVKLGICENVINQYSNLLVKLGQPALSAEEDQLLRHYVEAVAINTPDAIQVVRDFYQGQLMAFHEKQANEVLAKAAC